MGFCEALTLLLEALCGSVVLGVDCAGCREHTQRTVPCGKNPTSTSFCEGRLVPTEPPRAARWQAGGAAAMTGPRCPPSRRGLEAVRGGPGRAGGAAPPGAGRRPRMAAAAASPSRELTQNPLQKTWEPYDNGLPAGHSAQRGGERGGHRAPEPGWWVGGCWKGHRVGRFL